MTLAQTSMNPDDWKEDDAENAARNGLLHTLKMGDPEHNAKILRKYYPLRAKLKKADTNGLCFQQGTVLKYARVKLTPHRYPIEVFFTGPTAAGGYMTRRISYNSSEVELLP